MINKNIIFFLLLNTWLKIPEIISPKINPIQVNIIDLPADIAPLTPSVFPNSGEKVINTPTTNQIGNPIRMQFKYLKNVDK